MKQLCVIVFLFLFTLSVSGQKADTLVLSAHDLEMHNLQPGNFTYVVYFKKTADGPAERITLVRISVERTIVNGRNLFQITQKWESGDEVVHTARKFYDPGFGKAQDATYQVTGSEFLVSSDGNKIDCWVMEHKFEVPAGGSGTERLWISKRTHEVLKEKINSRADIAIN